VDPNADPKLPAEPLGDKTLNQHSGTHCGVGMLREVIRSTEHSERAVAEELVDMPTGVDDGRHHDFEQGIEASDGVLGAIRLGERGEIADIDKHQVWQ
jgi:hypothetical protein